MSNCIKDLYDYDLDKKCRVCKNILLKSFFYTKKTKRDGYRSECISCCKEYCHKNKDQLLNIMKYYKLNR